MRRSNYKASFIRRFSFFVALDLWYTAHTRIYFYPRNYMHSSLTYVYEVTKRPIENLTIGKERGNSY